jgi:hypothetical protein
MSITAKTQKSQKTHVHCNENEQRVQTHQKTHEPTSKNTKISKIHEHCTENEGVQTHQKTHEHSSKNTKR